MKISPRPVEIGPMLARLNEDFAPGAAQKGLELVFDESAVVVESDRTYLRRILQNLISNAIRYTDAGSVRVTTSAGDGSIRISVSDTGPGIPEHEQQNIFRGFHRLNARASAADGMGLGLAIVERACLLLDHPLGIRSEPGKGTSFTITLPIALPTLPSAPLQEMTLRKSIDHDTARIVCLVENDADLRSAMTQLLEKRGFEVIDAQNGEEVLALLEEIDIVPDYFLVDLQLGEGMDGLDLVAELGRRYGSIKARIVTANRDPDIGRRCLAAEVGILWKPINEEEIMAFIGSQ
jgi:CheY-like chemotaxis protein/anti-sigma regulatory factor (Ser/Thr protein kinase)